MPLKISQFLALFVFTSNVMAAPALARKDTTACETALSSRPQRATALDYAASDLEGTFLTLVQKIQDAGSVPPSRLEYYVQEVLNMKAALLNEIGGVLPYAMRDSDPERSARMVKSVYQMIVVLGIPPQIYGFKTDAQGRASLPKIRMATGAPSLANDNNLRSPPIGFLAPLDAAAIASHGQASDMSPGQQRSIGFAQFTYREEAPPARHTGELEIGIAQQNESILVVYDGETGKTYVADIRILKSAGSEIGGKRFTLDINQEVQEWLIKVDNLLNPTGRIGFL